MKRTALMTEVGRDWDEFHAAATYRRSCRSFPGKAGSTTASSPSNSTGPCWTTCSPWPTVCARSPGPRPAPMPCPASSATNAPCSISSNHPRGPSSPSSTPATSWASRPRRSANLRLLGDEGRVPGRHRAQPSRGLCRPRQSCAARPRASWRSGSGLVYRRSGRTGRCR